MTLINYLKHVAWRIAYQSTPASCRCLAIKRHAKGAVEKHALYIYSPPPHPSVQQVCLATMNAAASIAGIVSFADLVLKYTTILSVWKDAPPTLRQIKKSLTVLRPVLEELGELHNHSHDTLLTQGINIGLFARDLKALENIANDTLGPKPNPRLWKRTAWMLKYENEARELGKRLDSHIDVFTFILTLVNRWVPIPKGFTATNRDAGNQQSK